MSVSERQVEAEIERVSGERVNETRLRLALGAARMGSWERNLRTGEDIWSVQQQELFGLTPGSFSDTHQEFLRLVHPDDRQKLEESVRRALNGIDSYRSEYRIVLPDGTIRWMAGTGDVIRDGHGTPTHMVGVTMDITDRKLAEQKLTAALEAEQAARRIAENADRAKDGFLATVSHELRTPLTAIFGWAQLLQTAPCSPEEILRGLKTIERNARSMARLVDDVLDVSRMVAGKLRLHLERVDLAAVLDAAIEAVRPTADAKRLEIRKEVLGAPAIVQGDTGRLQQVIWNLLANAVKFTPEGGHIQVEVLREGAEAQIRVSDDGDGIAPDFLPHLFERFTQANSSSKRSHSGLGLGLAIVHQLVELHGGKVSASSGGPGLGATFTVRIPVIEEAAHEVTAPAPSVPPRRPSAVHNLTGVEVLIVDDDREAQEFLGKLLGDCGARVRTASSSPEALAVLESHLPAVLVSAIGLPGEDGYDLIRAIRERERAAGRSPLPAAAVTAFAGPEDREIALRAGFQVHVAKPFEPGELISIVADLVRLSDLEPASCPRLIQPI